MLGILPKVFKELEVKQSIMIHILLDNWDKALMIKYCMFSIMGGLIVDLIFFIMLCKGLKMS